MAGQALLAGSLLVLMGMFALAMSGPLSSWATNWNLFLRTEDMATYRTKKRRRIRLYAKIFLAAGVVAILGGFIGWVSRLG
ncbi:hypothetical protein AU252_08510 [Pseudarthrobacter sulfonivorans]|uniref:Uncharacterized protein n=1 Tax=Pseudarthrobacter sulfonivorans TaxID=121292 RepID=A0A0U3PA69_9MICC|nr:hypothetical protein AU252_08510 [Pseudarthrobacter sulfonivorans]